MFYVYILRTNKNTLYIGQTSDVEKRLREHKERKIGSKHLRAFTDLKVVYTESFETRSEALKREAFLKKLPKKEKELLVASNNTELSENIVRQKVRKY